MIPKFPAFKLLELSDKIEIETFTSKYLPYSDFNFVSLWSWNIQEKISISILNNNLVVIFTDYLTNQPFISFFGSEKTHETAQTIFDYSQKSLNVNYLKLLPEFLSLTLCGNGWHMTEDKASKDYILSIENLSIMNSWSNSKIAKSINKFQIYYPNYQVFVVSIENIDLEKHIDLFNNWVDGKDLTNINCNEIKAFKRYLDLAASNIIFISIYLNDKLIGFDTCELISSEYAISHFSKSDNQFKGINEMLQWEEAKYLYNLGVKYLNIEQDLGIDGLRFAKEKFKPSHYLKKFILEKSISH